MDSKIPRIPKRNYELELEFRVSFIRGLLKESGAEGIVFGNSGGKDSALVGVLCKKACDNTVGVMMPCHSKRNFNEDIKDASLLAESYDIQNITVDLTELKLALCDKLAAVSNSVGEISGQAVANIAPRLRMTALYLIAQSRNSLVAGTGNRSEIHMGYFTKWGDGAYDFNPIGDLTVHEIYEFLKYLDTPAVFFEKAPSAGLFDGQTDETEMGISYREIDDYLLNSAATDDARAIIEKAHNSTAHKRIPAKIYKNN